VNVKFTFTEEVPWPLYRLAPAKLFFAFLFLWFYAFCVFVEFPDCFGATPFVSMKEYDFFHCAFDLVSCLEDAILWSLLKGTGGTGDERTKTYLLALKRVQHVDCLALAKNKKQQNKLKCLCGASKTATTFLSGTEKFSWTTRWCEG
jgi:hypothetical protein